MKFAFFKYFNNTVTINTNDTNQNIYLPNSNGVGVLNFTMNPNNKKITIFCNDTFSWLLEHSYEPFRNSLNIGGNFNVSYSDPTSLITKSATLIFPLNEYYNI
jgi:hypothetical protein